MGNYYGTLVNTDLDREKQTEKTYVDGIMHVIEANFEKWALQKDERVEHSSNERPIEYISRNRFLSWDTSSIHVTGMWTNRKVPRGTELFGGRKRFN